MLDFLSLWLLLSLPVFLLLFVNLRGKQRFVYTHTLLSDFQDRTIGDFLFRTFHLYYDIILDLILALLTALFLSGLLGSAADRTAVCVDGSYSMLLGAPGETPLNEAFRRSAEEEFAGADLYLLAFDPARGRSRLASLRRARRRGDLENLVEDPGKFGFFNQDYAPCGALFERGYGRVVVLSDHPAAPGGSLEFQTVGPSRPQSFFYPTSVDYDFAAGSFRLTFQLRNMSKEVQVSVYREDSGDYAPVPDAEISGRPDSLLCRLPERGLYRFAAGEMDFVFNLAAPAAPARAVGDFSRIILEVLPQIEEGGGGLLLLDQPFRAERLSSPREVRRALRRELRSAGAFQHALVTFVTAGEAAVGSYIHPLPASLSRPAAAELPGALLGFDLPGVTLFYQDPARKPDPQTPIVYLSALERGQAAAYETQPEGGLPLMQRHRTSYVYRRGDEHVAVNLASEELYGAGREPPLIFESPQPRRKLIFLLLLCFYILKSVMLLLLERPAAIKAR
jgi:hypothetical protein